MKVRELMEMLKDIDPEMEVMIPSMEDGYYKVNAFIKCDVDIADLEQGSAWYHDEYQKHNALVYDPKTDTIGPNPVEADLKAIVITHIKEELK